MVNLINLNIYFPSVHSGHTVCPHWPAVPQYSPVCSDCPADTALTCRCPCLGSEQTKQTVLLEIFVFRLKCTHLFTMFTLFDCYIQFTFDYMIRFRWKGENSENQWSLTDTVAIIDGLHLPQCGLTLLCQWIHLAWKSGQLIVKGFPMLTDFVIHTASWEWPIVERPTLYNYNFWRHISIFRNISAFPSMWWIQKQIIRWTIKYNYSKEYIIKQLYNNL